MKSKFADIVQTFANDWLTKQFAKKKFSLTQ